MSPIKIFQKKWGSSEFCRHAMMMIGGAGAAQMLTIALSPILTRLYSPQDFGLYAFYLSLTLVLANVASGQYEKAIFLPGPHKEGYRLAVLALVLTTVVSTAFLLLIFLFRPLLDSLLGEKTLGSLWYAVPFTVLAMGIGNTLSNWFSRKKDYCWASASQPLKSLVTNGGAILLGLSYLGAWGLVAANMLGLAVVATRFIRKFQGEPYETAVSKADIKTLALRYKKFPQFTLPQAVLGALSIQFPIILIAAFFSPAATGFYFLAHRMVSMPLAVVSDGLSQVFFQTFSTAENRKELFISKFKTINFIGLPCALVLWVAAPWVFRVVFGAEWEVSGDFVRIILPLLYGRFISNLFTTPLYLIYERQFENFAFSVAINISIAGSLIFGGWMQDISLGLVCMTFSNLAFNLLKLIRCYGFITAGKTPHAHIA